MGDGSAGWTSLDGTTTSCPVSLRRKVLIRDFLQTSTQCPRWGGSGVGGPELDPLLSMLEERNHSSLVEQSRVHGPDGKWTRSRSPDLV